MSDNFTHLHVHTTYSFLDGMCKLSELIEKAKSLGMTSLAITDHNHLGGTYEFQKQCIAAGIKPILGYEGYYSENIDDINLDASIRKANAAKIALKNEDISQDEFDVITGIKKITKITKKSVEEKIKPYMPDLRQYHIIFLAMNKIGWSNVIKIQSQSAEQCTYRGRFTCNDILMEKYSEGVICTTACIASRIARYVNSNDEESAEKLLLKWANIFKDRFYLEIQPLDIGEQIKTNSFYYRMSKKHSLPVIATNDVHYINKEDHDDHDTLLCIGTGTIKSYKGPGRMEYSNDFWLRSYDEMIEAFTKQFETDRKALEILPDNYLDFCKQALAETNKLAARIDSNIPIGSKTPLIPQVKLKPGETPEASLRKQCIFNLYKLAKKDEYVKKNFKKYLQRVYYELNIICAKGFDSYMLVVQEYTSWANENKIYTAFGRGSAAGSLCLYLLGVTKVIDPIKNDLIFERFLTEDRKLAPDIDIDFLYSGRDRVIEHLEEYYTPQCVCHIGTYTQMGVKSGIKDVCRVLDIPFAESNQISKELDKINDTPQPKFKDFDNLKNNENHGDLKKWEQFNELETKYKNIFRLARRFEGTHRNFGVHASGILVMPFAVNEMIPTRVADGVRVCLYTGPEVEEQNCVKCDILGLKTIDLVVKTLKDAKPDIDFNTFCNTLNMSDPKVYEMLTNKKTDAVFQLESDLFKSMVSDIKPDKLSDITAITSLGRPGPLSNGMHIQYAKRKRGEEKPEPLLRGMGDILKDTYGLIIYQEEVMWLGMKAFGFNSNQSDSILRKIIGKKKKDKLEMLRRMIKYGKKNIEGPEGWHENPNLPWYDPNGKEYGDEISGGLANGYSEFEMDEFWNKLIQFASYCFNKSHAATYSALSYATAYLKYYYPVEFYAAVLSIQSDSKIEAYSEVCEHEGIKILTPDINISNKEFTPDAKDKTIYYGLGSIKGAGDAPITEIIKARPYHSLQEIFDKLPKKYWNKKIAEAMAKAGALDSFEINRNRYALLNTIHTIRKDKNYEVYDEKNYNESVCIEFETKILSAPITFKPWWKTVEPNKKITEKAYIISKNERIDKNGNMMCFAQLKINNCDIEAIIFSSVYKKCIGVFDENLNPSHEISVSGIKDEKGKLIVKSASVFFELMKQPACV